MALRDDVVALIQERSRFKGAPNRGDIECRPLSADVAAWIADAIIPLVRAAERKRYAAWHEAQAAWHEERADHPVTMIDGSSSKIGHDLAAHRRRQAAWHREAAAAIRNLKEQAND
jgi:hypothetical protein